jgi:hypothetical protein
MTPPAKKPFVVKSGKKDIVIGIAAGALILGFVLFGIKSMSNRVVDKGLTGTITAKHFAPQQEQQITIGKGGMHERKLEGEYTFEVSAENKIYTVWVDKSVYDSRKVGDHFYFLRPQK